MSCEYLKFYENKVLVLLAIAREQHCAESQFPLDIVIKSNRKELNNFYSKKVGSREFVVDVATTKSVIII